MQALSDLLQTKTPTINKTVATETGLNKTSFKQKTTDLVIAEATDLLNLDFLGWYYKVAFLIGVRKFEQLAAVARVDGSDPARLFSYLLRKEMCGEL